MQSFRSLLRGALIAPALLLADCHETPPSDPATGALQDPLVLPTTARGTSRRTSTPVPVESPPPLPAAPAPAQRGYHRYQGTVGGRPVLVELMVEEEEEEARFTCSGSYYYLHSGERHSFESVYSFRAAESLALREGSHNWYAQQPLGPYLSGTCLPQNGQPQEPFELRESYAGAVRYEILSESLADRVGKNYFGGADTSWVALDYLHLLGPDTLRPALARLQCPVPAKRARAQRQLSAALTPDRDYMAATYQKVLWVTLNEADLLCYQEKVAESVVGKRHADHSGGPHLLDLRTGRQLTLLAQLRPGRLSALRELLTRQARRDTTEAARYWVQDGQLLPVPAEVLTMMPTGWVAFYHTAEEDSPYHSYRVDVSWAELRPLLRPQSPLWRLFKARGL